MAYAMQAAKVRELKKEAVAGPKKVEHQKHIEEKQIPEDSTILYHTLSMVVTSCYILLLGFPCFFHPYPPSEFLIGSVTGPAR